MGEKRKTVKRIKTELSPGENLLAGSLARGIAATLLHPIDVLRTRSQARNVKTIVKSPSDVIALFSKGLAPCVLLSIPAGAIQFMSFEKTKKLIKEKIPHAPPVFVQSLSAAVGATCSSIFRTPQEVLKQRVQADLYPNVVAAVSDVLKKEGFKGLYSGYWSQYFRDIPFNTIAFVFFDRFQTLYTFVTKQQPDREINLYIGAGAGALSAMILTPVDVVKTRVMVRRPGEAQTYSGVLQTLKKIASEEGVGALMKGVIPRVVYLSPMSALMLSIFEEVKKALLRSRNEQEQLEES
mmetsp:Transcript_26788/g.43747  ORF Transcript_26788/g.43747 Transcript_26788/m.43747 type:complete len:295 (+) Transcript_26788:55-939(+)|eukprot:CAMPEP_0184658978 /NCGR_PEP_ID=MMETSP0308-20130426/27620_1 /TAXON_ID=38269 /ORGANISM="Gloeochaete witrockiana, Strain SAG 46.84" /LENGTH=294 /DNA_ID=CAMNT_0027098389 /DNA_START=12 /DNA_END=896 /DNA_ORIENTATION=-